MPALPVHVTGAPGDRRLALPVACTLQEPISALPLYTAYGSRAGMAVLPALATLARRLPRVLAAMAVVASMAVAGGAVGEVARAGQGSGVPMLAHIAAVGGAGDAAGVYAGWAMDAYPGDSVATLKAEMQKQITAGATIVWLGQNNPGEVGATKHEPGLSYAVWQALEDPASPLHSDAVAMAQAVHNALDAARSLGVPVVLPVGYQIQMGQAWNAAHPQDLRVDGRGVLYNNGGESASFYSPDYQHDILAYYHWVDTTYIRPYSDTIRMINIADEPQDGDYTVWADRAFRQHYGFSMSRVGKDPTRLTDLGRFQADYIANYAAWSANQWLAIDPGLKVTISFDGGYSRSKHEGPDLEDIFQQAPPNFEVTFDAFPKDGLYNTPMQRSDLYGLFSLIATLGHYSAVYHRPLWFWSTANSWGLNGASSDPGNIADAAANAIYLAQLVNQSGGTLHGIAVWNYNIKSQGLFNDTHPYYYDPNQMFARVSATFPLIRAIMAAPPAHPTTLILASNAHDLLVGGQIRALRALDSYNWASLAAFAHDDVAAPDVTHLAGEDLSQVNTVVVLDRSAADLSAADRSALELLLADGGTVVAAAPIAALLAPAGAQALPLAQGGTPLMTVQQVAPAMGRLLAVSGGPVERLFTDAAATWADGVVQSILHTPLQSDGLLVSAAGTTLLYSGLATPGANMVVSLPLPGVPKTLTVYNTSGVATQTIALTGRNGSLRVSVPRRSYALAVAG